MPFILLLIYLGAFAEKNAFEDMMIVLAFGALGWVMVQLDWQRPPLLLGLVLGPLMENRLFLSTDNYGLAWLWRPGVLILFALTLLGIFYPVIKAKWQKKEKAETPYSTAGAAGEIEKGAIRFWDALFTLSIVIVLALALWQSQDFGFRAGLFPWTIGFPVLALAMAQLGLELAGKVRRSASESTPDAAPDLPKSAVYQRTVSIIGWILGFFVAIWLLGFSLAVAVTTFLYLKVGANENWPITIILTAVGWGFFYGLFDYSLHIPFPEGQLFVWLK